MDEQPRDDAQIRERFRSAQLRQPEGVLPSGGPMPANLVNPAVGPAPDTTHLFPHPSGMPIPTPDLDVIPTELKQMFVVETRDDLRDLRQALIQFELTQDMATLRDIGRIAHKIKGAAATLEYSHMAALAHTFEDMLIGISGHGQAPDAHAITLLNRGLAVLEACLEAAAEEIPDDASLASDLAALRDELLLGMSRTDQSAPKDDSATMTAPRLSGDTRPVPVARREKGHRIDRVWEGDTFVRVDTRRLDDLMARVNSLATNRATLARIQEEIERFQSEMDHAIDRLKLASTQVSDLQPMVQALAQSTPAGERPRATSGRLGLFQQFTNSTEPPAPFMQPVAPEPSTTRQHLELERYTELDQALRALAEAVADVTSHSIGLRDVLRRFGQTNDTQQALMAQMQADITAIRLVPLLDLVPRLQLAAKQTANDRQKLIAFTVHGELTQIDRNISEALADPLTQLVRNAIVHGIETPDERREAGKETCGRVWLRAYYVGNEVSIEVGDDGCGINPHMLVASAIAAGMLDPEVARTLLDTEAFDLMFVQGITTLDTAHVAGGRGIGLDDVRTVIERLKGSIQVSSELGRGTIFRIRVPISLSVLKVLHVGVAGGAYAVPFSSVQHSISLSPDELFLAAGGAAPGRHVGRARIDSARLRLSEKEGTQAAAIEMPALSLADLLGYERHFQNPQPALVLDVGHRRVALLVESLGDEHEVVVRALPKHLRRRAVRGGTVTLDGQVLLLLDLPELIAGHLEGNRPLPSPRPAPRFAREPAPRVMVVDDSNSMRAALELMLSRAGYDVQLARDGYEALGLLRESLPQAMILDIEMPRLDGFEVLHVIRRTPAFAGLRVAMLTTKSGERHRAHATALGADAYLTKPCPDNVLLDTLGRLISMTNADS
jgi:chemosensory pili system protein ChpA (sensor histidine kinase/response regulator)